MTITIRTHLQLRKFMYKIQYRLGAGKHQKYLHSSNFTCTNLHMQVVFRALTFYMYLLSVRLPDDGSV